MKARGDEQTGRGGIRRGVRAEKGLRGEKEHKRVSAARGEYM